MRLKLIFEDLDGDVAEAVARIRLEDVYYADGLAQLIDTTEIGPFEVFQSDSEVLVNVDLCIPQGVREPALFVRVAAMVNANPAQFVTATTTLLTPDKSDPVEVVLSRIE